MLRALAVRLGVSSLSIATTLVLISCTAHEPASEPSAAAGAGLAVGEVGVQASWDSATMPAGQPRIFRVVVEVPPNHHGYLDRGDDGLLIPISFSLSGLDEAGARVTSVSRPRGERDEKVRATVLRGKGSFVFRLESGASTSGGGLEGSLRYQICNDLTSVCYRPQETPISIPAAQ